VLLGMSRAQADERAEETVAGLELDPSMLDRMPHDVSGGQRQRFSIARSMVLQPHILFCDEVVSALDVSVQGSVLNLLKKHCSDFGGGMVFVSHGLPATAFISKELVVMYQGRIVERGPRRDVLFTPQDEYTKRLVNAYATVREPVLEARSA
jgi:peptide/nickel transport system ATP-binding protein